MRLKFLAALPVLLAVPAVFAQSDPGAFTVGDIRIEGLQRISEGTVFNYLPVNIGDRLDSRRVEEALRSLYSTGFFRDVELRRDGGTLIVVVLERPSIESFTIDGNKDIKTEDLEKSLRNVGLARGKTFDQSTLDEVKRFLTDQYYSRGKYGVKVDTRVDELPDNRVKIAIDIVEGKRSRIRQINIVGNEAFDDEELLEPLKLRTPNWLSWYRQDDRYSREELSGDIEKLRSFYLDRGYANFEVDSTQVAIAPDREDIFITMNVNEGEVYRISDVKIAGKLVVPEEDLRALLQVRRGDIYSQRMISATTEFMAMRLGVDGYAFAKIDPVPQQDPETKEIALTFLVDPGNRAYVRRINFNGTTSINDDVLRREMRQMEGGYLSNAAVDRSRLRLQRLPYIEDVKVETSPVAGSPDLVDVNFDIKEGLPGQFAGGIGYSESQSVLLNGSFVHSNFMGTGNRVAAELNAGQYSKVFSLSHTDPYIDGRRNVRARSRRRTAAPSASSPARPRTSRRTPARWRWTTAGRSPNSSRCAWAWRRSAPTCSPTRTAAHARRSSGCRTTATPTRRMPDFGVPPVSYHVLRHEVRHVLAVLARLVVSIRGTGPFFADRGARHRLNLSYTLPGSDVEFYTVNYDYLQFVPLGKWFTLSCSTASIGYGESLGDTTSMPPYRRFFAGGPESCAGYRESRLGPKDSFGNPYGGNLKFTNQVELLLPMPAKWRNSARFSVFFDAGNVFSTDDVAFVGRDGVTPVELRVLV
jgi:outer membrane protein insertion porin family